MTFVAGLGKNIPHENFISCFKEERKVGVFFFALAVF
jgi:hypothetical protein